MIQFAGRLQEVKFRGARVQSESEMLGILLFLPLAVTAKDQPVSTKPSVRRSVERSDGYGPAVSLLT